MILADFADNVDVILRFSLGTFSNNIKLCNLKQYYTKLKIKFVRLF